MKKLIALTLALLTLILPCLATAEYTFFPAADGATITVTGSATISLPADYARVSVGVSTKAVTVDEATRENSQTIRAVIDALVDFGVAEEDIVTNSYSVYAEHDYSGGEQKLVGYNVTNQLTVIIRDMEHIGATLDKATAAGANNIYNIEFLSTQSAEAQEAATILAVQEAYRKAQLLANAGLLFLGGVKSITESSSGLYVTERTVKLTEDAVSNSILPDEASVSASVTIVFELE